MTGLPTIPIASPARSFADRLRGIGVLHVAFDATGTTPSPSGEDWLASLLLGATYFRRQLAEVAKAWSASPEPRRAEILPGCWAVPLPIVRGRRRCGCDAAIILTDELLLAEEFHTLCQSARADREVTARLIAQLPPASSRDVERIARLVQALHDDLHRVTDLESTGEKLGQQLAESYEEINLLYTISQNMNVVQRPLRFVRSVCEGLLETLPYRWIGVHFTGEEPCVSSLAGEFVTAGETPAPVEQLRRDLPRLVELLAGGEPLVLTPASNPAHRPWAPLGQPILAHPVSRDGRLIGTLLAGNKYGEDSDASSVDMKLLSATASHMGIFLENASLYEDMNATFLGTLEALTAAIDAKDHYTSGHSQRVAFLSQRLAEAIGLNDETVRRVHVAGLVHDVGKIGVPEAVLRKASRLTEREFGLIKAHPEIGYRILKDIPQLKDVLPGVLYHHERWDGEGYPRGLAGEDIPVFARVIALADSFDAMSSNRTYRSARKREWVLGEIRRCAGTQFDPSLVPAFLSLDFSEFDRLVNEQKNPRHAEPIFDGDADTNPRERAA